MGGPSSKEVGAQQQSWQNLNSLFSTASNASKDFGSAGKGTLDQVTSYFKNLLGGNRQSSAEAVAPAANAARAGADAAKKQEADMGTGRTGGTVAANQQGEDKVRSEIDTLIGGVKPAAANALGSLGEADIGAMMSALGLGTNAAATVGGQTTSDINAQRTAAADMWSNLISGGAKLGAAFIP